LPTVKLLLRLQSVELGHAQTSQLNPHLPTNNNKADYSLTLCLF
jgi:hypothetical protein